MITRLLFVRHGHSEANRLGVFGGHCDYDLTETGIKQAGIMSKFVRERYHVDAICSSDLRRALRTAETVAGPLGLPIERYQGLREIFGGEWEAMPFGEIAEKYEPEFKLWQNDLSRVRVPGGETVYDLQKRARETLAEIYEKHPGQTVLVATHRVFLRTVQCLWEHIPLEEINRCGWLSNCSVSEVTFDGRELVPVRVGQDDFMREYVTAVNSLM